MSVGFTEAYKKVVLYAIHRHLSCGFYKYMYLGVSLVSFIVSCVISVECRAEQMRDVCSVTVNSIFCRALRIYFAFCRNIYI